MADRGARRQSLAAIAALAVGTLAPCLATPCVGGSLEGIAGWEGDRQQQGYGFATIGTAAPEGGGWSIPARLTGSYLYYEYETAGYEVRVRAPGAGAMLGLRAARSRGSAALLAGCEVRWERRRRESASAGAATVARVGVVAQGEVQFPLGERLRPLLLASYSGSARYVYGRAELRWQCSNLDWSGPVAWFIGLEGAAQGNADTDAIQGGGSIGCSFVPSRLSVGLHGGYKDSGSSDGARRTGGYAGVSLYRRF